MHYPLHKYSTSPLPNFLFEQIFKLHSCQSELVLCRALAEEDITSDGPRPIAEAIGGAASELYSSGSVAASKLPSLNAWLTKEKCMFPDVIESLAMGHLDKGDKMSAMITSEW